MSEDNKYTFINVEDVISTLTGTKMTIQEALYDLYEDDFKESDLSEDDKKQIDEALFKCEECDIWFERNEESCEEAGLCNDCYETEL